MTDWDTIGKDIGIYGGAITGVLAILALCKRYFCGKKKIRFICKNNENECLFGVVVKPEVEAVAAKIERQESNGVEKEIKSNGL